MDVPLTGRRAGKPVEQEILIRTIEVPGPHWVSGLIAAHGLIEARLVDVAHEETLADEAVRRVYRFAVGAQTPVTPNVVITDVLTIETYPPSSMRRVPEISVTAEFTPAVRAVPHEVWFRLSDNATFPMKRSVLLVATDDAPWSFSFAENLPPWLEISMERPAEETAPGVKRMLVSVNEQVREIVAGEEMPQRALVRIGCKHPECDEAELAIVVSR